MIYKRTRGEHKVLILVPRGKRVRECTHMIVRILYEGIATGLTTQRTCLMKEVVEAHEFAKLGEDLDESISGERRNPLVPAQRQVPGGTVRTHPLLGEDCRRTDGS